MVIIVAGLISGTLDLCAALLLFVSVSRKKPAMLLRYVASAALGPKAFSGGTGMVLWGLCFHYLIALFWATCYFIIFPRTFPCTTIITNAVVYGLVVWVMMNLVVLPLSKAEPRPFSPFLALANIAILIIAIGWPCALIASLYPFLHF